MRNSVSVDGDLQRLGSAADAAAPVPDTTQTLTSAEWHPTKDDLPGSAAKSFNAVWLYLSVTDNGCGIGPEDLPKLYKAFQQLEAGIEYKGRGTGLGLAITREIIARTGGTVGVRSAPGKG